MNGLDRITARIAAETEAEITAVSSRTREECGEIKASYEKLAQEEYWRIAEKGTKDIELQVQRLSRTAALEARKSILAMKQRAVEGVLDGALDAICKLPDAEYAAFLAKLAGKASSTGEEEIVLNARDLAAHGKSVVKEANDILKKRKRPAMLRLSGTAGDFKGGLILKQGDISVNCTVETLISLERDRLGTQIAEILFEE